MYKIGIDIGGTNIKAGIVAEDGKIIKKSSIKAEMERDYREVVASIAKQIQALISESEIKLDEIEMIGVGVPGSVDKKKGMVKYANNLGWLDIPLGEELKKYIDKPIKLGNDANVAALGEARYGAGKEYNDIIMLTLGTGVGGGIIINNEIYDGNEGMGAELGHAIIEMNGEQCTCGRKGCLEAYVSATALIRDTKRKMECNPQSIMWEAVNGDIEKVDGRTAFDCAKKNDTAATEVVTRYIRYLADSIMNYCNIFRPNAIILGGGVCAEKEYLTDRLEAICEKEAYGYRGTPKVEIKIASLKNDAGIIGAACL